MIDSFKQTAVTVPREQLFGLDESELVVLGAITVHRDIARPLDQLGNDAVEAGFQLAVASAYRGFERQLAIWNAKAAGSRPVLDANGHAVDISGLDDTELLFAILRWSALPGASRHHWGTDIDVYDAAAVAPDYQVQLTGSEVGEGGVFAAFHEWLDRHIQAGKSHGFYRPYTGGRGSIAAERWHLSNAPANRKFENSLSADALYRFIEQEPRLLLKQAVLENFDRVFNDYVAIYNGLDSLA